MKSPREYEWLLIEWPKDENAPTKYWLSTMSETTSLVELVTTSMLRWRIERDYQNLKQELGLGQYEGQSWQGFHHHAFRSERDMKHDGERELHLVRREGIHES